DDGVEGLPRPCGAAGPAVDDEVVRTLGDLRVQVVHEHAQRRLGLPASGGQVGAAGGTHGTGSVHDGHSFVQFSGPVTDSAAVRTEPSRTARWASARSGAVKRSGPGSVRPRTSMTAPVAGDGRRGARSAIPRAAVCSSIATTRASASTLRRSVRAAPHPIDTWSSCIALLGIESTLEGAARRFISETIPAAVYWAIISPESVPGSSARNGGSP